MRRFRNFMLLTIIFTSIVFYAADFTVYAEDAANRLWGSDRYITAIEVSKSGWTSTSQYAVLVTGDNYPDALCASPLAKLLDAPILLTMKPKLDAKVLDELKRMQVQKVFIIGGTGVISSSIETALKQNGMEYERLQGSDRYLTSMAVANRIAEITGQVSEAAVVTGDNYPDALSIAPVAAMKEMPILLTEKSKLSDDISAYIAKNGVAKTYVIGGTGVVSKDVENKLPQPQRLEGSDRYATNLAVLRYFFNELSFDTTYLATGNAYPDALAGAALAGKMRSPIILIDKVPGQTTQDFVADNRLLMRNMVIIGGVGAVAYSSVEPLLPKIASINNINVYVNHGENYSLPDKVTAAMDNNTSRDVSVTWNSGTADTTKGVVQVFSGSVKGYAGNVKLTLVINHPVMGKSQATAEQMAKFLLNSNSSPNISVTPLELATMFLEEGRAEGVRGDIAFCQSIHETGWFKFGGQVLPEQNNYSGIGATNNSPVGKGAWFDSPRDGVRAQIQHLKAYASKDPIINPIIDPRYDILKQNNLLGIAPNWEDLSGRWAVPGYSRDLYSSLEEAKLNGGSYGQSIIKLYEQMKSIK